MHLYDFDGKPNFAEMLATVNGQLLDVSEKYRSGDPGPMDSCAKIREIRMNRLQDNSNFGPKPSRNG